MGYSLEPDRTLLLLLMNVNGKNTYGLEAGATGY